MTRKKAIETGGASGLGLACARRLRADGIEVITVDIASDADIRLDVSDWAAVESVAKEVGAIDVLVNSAGIIGPFESLWEIENEKWARTLAVNLNGTFHTCKAFVPGMIQKRWGRIVNIASIAGKEGNPKFSAYSASQAAEVDVTDSAAVNRAVERIVDRWGRLDVAVCYARWRDRNAGRDDRNVGQRCPSRDGHATKPARHRQYLPSGGSAHEGPARRQAHYNFEPGWSSPGADRWLR